MRPGRPRTPIGTHGDVRVRRVRGRFVTVTRYRDLDGRLRVATATADSRAAANRTLQERLSRRPRFGAAGMLDAQSKFTDLAKLWLVDVDISDLSENTKKNYRDDLNRRVLPAFGHYTLAEMTTGRLDWFLKNEARVSYSRAKHSKTLLSLMFGFALRHDAVDRNPLDGTANLRKPKPQPLALTVAQIGAIRKAAMKWRTGVGVKGPKPDGKVRDILELLLGSALRIGEALALRVKDIEELPSGMVITVAGTVVMRKGQGAIRQDHPKTEASIRRIVLPEFAAEVLRRRVAELGEVDPERTVFANRNGTPLSPHNVRRTFREMLELAKLGDSGITLRWYRRTGATVVARGAGKDAAATFLGHSSSEISETHYIEPDRTIDPTAARLLEKKLRPRGADGRLLAAPATISEEALLDVLDDDDDEEEAPAA